MAFKTLCANCENRRLVAPSAVTPKDTVLVVTKGGVPFCFAPENRVDPVTGDETLPVLCAKANPTASCAWFVISSVGEKAEGVLRIRGGDGWVIPEIASGLIIPGLLSDAEVAANLAAEAANAPPPPPPPWDVKPPTPKPAEQTKGDA